MKVEEMIQRYARAKRIKPEEYEAFKEKIKHGLVEIGFNGEEIDIELFKKIAKERGRL